MKYNSAKSDLKVLAHHLLDCLAPLGKERLANAGRLKRLPKGFRLPSASTLEVRKTAHSFGWNGKNWVGYACFLKTSNPARLGPPRSFCGGVSYFENLILDPLGHELWGSWAPVGCSLKYRARCWNYAITYPKHLRRPCRACDSTVRPSVKFYLSKGLHPRTREVLEKPTKLHGL